MLLEVALPGFTEAEDPSHASEVSVIKEVWGATPVLFSYLSLRSSEWEPQLRERPLSSVVGDGTSSSDRVVPPRFLPLV